MAQEGDGAWHIPTTDVAREQQRQQQQQQQQQQRGASHQRRLGDIQVRVQKGQRLMYDEQFQKKNE
jgi:hypothetical protein